MIEIVTWEWQNILVIECLGQHYSSSSVRNITQNKLPPHTAPTKSWLTHVCILCVFGFSLTSPHMCKLHTHLYILRPKSFNRILNYLWIEDFIEARSMRYTCMCIFLWANKKKKTFFIMSFKCTPLIAYKCFFFILRFLRP